MLLSGEQIKRTVDSGEILITPFDESFLKGASYAFTLGGKLKKLKQTKYIDTRNKNHDFEEFEIGEDGYLLQPGEFVICHTKEKLRLGPNIACFLSMKGSQAQAGLDALQCEIFCEPGSEGGWDGKLMLETSNRGPYPVKLFPGVKIVKGIFVRI